MKAIIKDIAAQLRKNTKNPVKTSQSPKFFASLHNNNNAKKPSDLKNNINEQSNYLKLLADQNTSVKKHMTTAMREFLELGPTDAIAKAQYFENLKKIDSENHLLTHLSTLEHYGKPELQSQKNYSLIDNHEIVLDLHLSNINSANKIHYILQLIARIGTRELTSDLREGYIFIHQQIAYLINTLSDDCIKIILSKVPVGISGFYDENKSPSVELCKEFYKKDFTKLKTTELVHRAEFMLAGLGDLAGAVARNKFKPATTDQEVLYNLIKEKFCPYLVPSLNRELNIRSKEIVHEELYQKDCLKRKIPAVPASIDDDLDTYNTENQESNRSTKLPPNRSFRAYEEEKEANTFIKKLASDNITSKGHISGHISIELAMMMAIFNLNSENKQWPLGTEQNFKRLALPLCAAYHRHGYHTIFEALIGNLYYFSKKEPSSVFEIPDTKNIAEYLFDLSLDVVEDKPHLREALGTAKKWFLEQMSNRKLTSAEVPLDDDLDPSYYVEYLSQVTCKEFVEKIEAHAKNLKEVGFFTKENSVEETQKITMITGL